jgi:hypothetical protein
MSRSASKALKPHAGIQVTRWPHKQTEALKLDFVDFRYLTEVGLPTSADGSWVLLGAPSPEDRDTSQKVKIGDDGPHALAIERATRHIVLNERKHLMFVNSALALYGYFLHIFQSYRRDVRGVEESMALKLVENVEVTMRCADPIALADPTTYWAMIVEQMKDGLL